MISAMTQENPFTMLKDLIVSGGPDGCSVSERLLLGAWWPLDSMRDEFSPGTDYAIGHFVALAEFVDVPEYSSHGSNARVSR